MSTHDVPLGINTAVGAVVGTAAVTVAGLLPLTAPQRVLVTVAAVGLFAAAVADPLAAVVTAALTFALYDGFVEDRSGALGWHAGDAGVLGALLVAAALGAVLGVLRRRARDGHRHRALEEWANAGSVRPVRQGVAR